MSLAMCLSLALVAVPSAPAMTEERIDVGGYTLQFNVTDARSDRTILMEAGGGADSSAWSGIRDETAAATGFNVVSYDRAGFGGSELGPVDRSPEEQLADLVQGLRALGFDRNLVVIAHSYGGLLAQALARDFPSHVDAMLLVDPMNVHFVRRFGIERLVGNAPAITEPRNPREAALMRMIKTLPHLVASLEQEDLPDSIPVSVITVGSPPYDETPQDVADWRQSHEDMVAGSPRHVLIEAPGNSHDVIAENPELILHALTQLVQRMEPEKSLQAQD